MFLLFYQKRYQIMFVFYLIIYLFYYAESCYMEFINNFFELDLFFLYDRLNPFLFLDSSLSINLYFSSGLLDVRIRAYDTLRWFYFYFFFYYFLTTFIPLIFYRLYFILIQWFSYQFIFFLRIAFFVSVFYFFFCYFLSIGILSNTLSLLVRDQLFDVNHTLFAVSKPVDSDWFYLVFVFMLHTYLVFFYWLFYSLSKWFFFLFPEQNIYFSFFDKHFFFLFIYVYLVPLFLYEIYFFYLICLIIFLDLCFISYCFLFSFLLLKN